MINQKVCIVTGGSGLLGKEIVTALLKKNYKVINFDKVNFQLTHNNYFFLKGDITSESSVKLLVDEVISCFGQIDGLVNNAYPRTKDWSLKFDEIPFSSWKENIDMQMNSVFNVIQNVIFHMQKRGQGSVVNVASIYGVVGNDMTIYEGTEIEPPAAYSAIKGGIIAFTRYLASAYGKHNIRINCVSPGGIFDNQNSLFVLNYTKRVPMRRMGRPDDIAPVVDFLLSEDSKYITGQNLIVDGGYTTI